MELYKITNILNEEGVKYRYVGITFATASGSVHICKNPDEGYHWVLLKDDGSTEDIQFKERDDQKLLNRLVAFLKLPIWFDLEGSHPPPEE